MVADRTLIRLADGTSVTIHEKFACDVKLGSITQNVNFLVKAHSIDSLVLRMDFLANIGASFTCGDQTLTLPSDR